MTSPRHLQNDLLAYLYSQLPRAVAEKIKDVQVRTDPFHIRTEACFVDTLGRKHTCQLENETINGTALACRLPEVFIAKLCVSV